MDQRIALTIPEGWKDTGPNSYATITALPLGFQIESKCAVGQGGVACDSPQNEGASNGFWPYRMEFKLDDCVQVSASELSCRLITEIGRAWTPSKGGGKPINDSLSYDIEIPFELIKAKSSAIRFETNEEVQASALLHDDPIPHRIPSSKSAMANPAVVTVNAMTGFAFELSPTSADLAKDPWKSGRYLQGLKFHVDQNSAHMGVSAPVTVTNAAVTSTVSSTALVLPSSTSATIIHQPSKGMLCTQGLSFYGKIPCPEGEDTKRSEVPISVPAPGTGP